MKLLLSSLLLIFLAAGCGIESSRHPQEKILSTRYSNTPVPLKKDFQQCLDEENYLHDGKVIQSVLFGERSEILSTPYGDRIRFLEKPRMAFVCKEEQNYSDNSIEASALQITKTIRKASALFRKVAPEIQIPPVKINLTPMIVKTELIANSDGTISKLGSYLTDNAFYRPSTSTITFLPHSSQHYRFAILRNLWNVPVVSAHEYGHHLFEHLLEGDRLPPADHSACFGEEEKVSNLKSFRIITKKEVLTAFNEGFSDLVAYYSLSPSERDLTLVRCLEVSRDVSSPTFYDGNPKTFHQAALRSFFSTTRSMQLSCEDTSYQDVHTLGAILAWSYNKFSGELTDSREEKLAALIEWARFLGVEYRRWSNQNPENFLRTSFSELLRISATRLNRSFDENLCQVVDEIFPDLDLKECRNSLSQAAIFLPK